MKENIEALKLQVEYFQTLSLKTNLFFFFSSIEETVL